MSYRANERTILFLPAENFILAKIPDFYVLTKPGITAAVLISASTGFVLASHPVNGHLLFHLLLGTAMVSAGGGALNMLLESHEDALMIRTRNRPIPAGRIAPAEAFLFGIFLASAGIVHICAMVNLRSGFLAALGILLYIGFYTQLKKRTYFCTVIGAISGALPPLIGWASLRNFDAFQPLILFSIVFFWQFVHLSALAWFHKDDYARTDFKMLPAGDDSGKLTASLALGSAFILLFLTVLSYFLGFYKIPTFLGSIVLTFFLLGFSIRFFRKRSGSSARELFLTTLFYLPLLFLLLILER